MQDDACRAETEVLEFDYNDEDFITSPTSPRVRTNQDVYGSKRPPALSVGNIQVPVKVYYSEGDTLITPAVWTNAILITYIGCRCRSNLRLHSRTSLNKNPNRFAESAGTRPIIAKCRGSLLYSG